MIRVLRFTGVIEDMGKVVFKNTAPDNKSVINLKINPQQILSRLEPGEDIAVNGVCLTIKEIDSDGFTVQLWPVTQEKTSLIILECGDLVNLERRMDREETENDPVCK
jgi:riboflavin synthase